MNLMKKTGLIVAAVALLGLSAREAAAQPPTVTWQQIGARTYINWTAVPGATQYDILVSGALNGQVTIPTNFVEVDAPAGTYIVQVRGRNGATVGDYSAPVTIVVTAAGGPPPSCGAVGAPAITVATSGGVVTVNWAAVAGAAGYRIQFGTSPGATQYQVDVPASQTSYSMSVPLIGTFYVRVLAGDACGTLTASNEETFTIGSSGTPGAGAGPRTPDPAPGTIIPRASLRYAEGVIAQMEAQYRGDFLNSCNSHTWLFRLVHALRQIDTRWGLNYVRGHAPRMSEDVIAYNAAAGPDEGAAQIYLFDVIGGHCGPNPGSWMNDITDVTWDAGQRGDPACANAFCARWTLEPYLRAGFPADQK